MHDVAPYEGRLLTDSGVEVHAAGTLVDRALAYLATGPADSPRITRDILGIPQAPAVVAERLAVALLGADPRVGRDDRGQWRVSPRGGWAPPLADCAFAVVDVETTGSRPAHGDRITEIAVVLVARGTASTVFESLIDPGRPIPRAVTNLTRITNAMVRGQPTFADIVDDVLAALAGRVFVAHNVAFDWRFVANEIRRTRHVHLDGPKVCTVKLARRYVAEVKNRGLDSLARYFGIEIAERHRAGCDARAAARLLTLLLERAEEHGARTLDDLTRVEPRRRKRKRRRASPTWMDGI